MNILLAVLTLAFCGCVELDKKNAKKATEASQMGSLPGKDLKASSIDPLTESELLQYQACKSNSDCIFVTNGCCDCANSGSTSDGKILERGKEIAINASKKQEFESRLACEEVGCTERARIPPCGSGKVTCENNLCTYTLMAKP